MTEEEKKLNGTGGTNEFSNLYGSVVSPQGQTSDYDNQLTELARNQNYKQYFNTAVQQANIGKLAQKYFNNSMKQNGLNTTGAGTTANAQLYNNLANQQANALSNYYAQEALITEDAVAESANQLSEYLNDISVAYQRGDKATANSLIEQYRKNLTGEALDNFNSKIASYGFESDPYAMGNAYNSAEELQNMVVSSGDGVAYAKDVVNNEINIMLKSVQTGNYPAGSVFHLVNADGKSGVYMYYDGNSFYQLNDNQAKEYNGEIYKIKGMGGTPTTETGPANKVLTNSEANEYGFPDKNRTRLGSTHTYNGKTYVLVSLHNDRLWVLNE